MIREARANKKNLELLRQKNRLLNYLEKLKVLESRLWGVTINRLSEGEEEVLEEANHLITILNKHSDENLLKVLSKKQIEDFQNDLRNLRNDFTYLKREIKRRNALRDLVSSFTIMMVNHKNYSKLEKVFILEKQLYEVIEKQERDLEDLVKHMTAIKIDLGEKKARVFLGSLKKIRTILAGHLDHHALWEDDRKGFSNTSNIIHSLIKTVDDTLK